MRRVAGILALFLVASGVVPVQCFGWQNSADRRMDCCRQAGHECPDQRAADTCCQTSEQHEEQSVPGISLLPGAPLLRAESIVFAPPIPILGLPTVHWFRLGIDARPSRPAYDFTSVLLI